MQAEVIYEEELVITFTPGQPLTLEDKEFIHQHLKAKPLFELLLSTE